MIPWLILKQSKPLRYVLRNRDVNHYILCCEKRYVTATLTTNACETCMIASRMFIEHSAFISNILIYLYIRVRYVLLFWTWTEIYCRIIPRSNSNMRTFIFQFNLSQSTPDTGKCALCVSFPEVPGRQAAMKWTALNNINGSHDDYHTSARVIP